MDKGKVIPLIELINFCEQYNSIGFGTATIIELKNKVIVKLYNAGYSENEELDYEFTKKYKTDIIFDYHPITIAVFSKMNMIYNNHIVDLDIDKSYDFYKEQKEFKYVINIE